MQTNYSCIQAHRKTITTVTPSTSLHHPFNHQPIPSSPPQHYHHLHHSSYILKLTKEPGKSIACVARLLAPTTTTSTTTYTTTYTYTTLPYTQTVHKLTDDPGKAIACVAMAGVGILVTFAGEAKVCVYHAENLRNLQDIDLSSALNISWS